MRRLWVMAGAMSAALAASSIAEAQQPAVPPPAAPSRSNGSPPSQTWTLFLVTVLYKSGWSVAPVAAFTGETAQAECQKAIDSLYAIRGVGQSNSEAVRMKGNTQYPICLPATAAKPSGGGGQAE